MTQLDRIEQELKQIKEILLGNGSPEKGVIVQLDRVTQFVKTRRWVERLIIAAIIGLTVKEFFV